MNVTYENRQRVHRILRHLPNGREPVHTRVIDACHAKAVLEILGAAR